MFRSQVSHTYIKSYQQTEKQKQDIGWDRVYWFPKKTKSQIIIFK
jgi:CO dehydrogenase/acetyl-CoA synthase beta subunit